jgi:hypothetical protein
MVCQADGRSFSAPIGEDELSLAKPCTCGTATMCRSSEGFHMRIEVSVPFREEGRAHV